VLAAFLLAGLVAAPVATLALFTRSVSTRRRAGAWWSVGRLVLSTIGTVLLAAVVACVLHVLDVTRANTIAGVAGLVALSALWLPVTRHWVARAHLAWVATFYLFAAYLTYMMWWTFVSHLGPLGTTGALLLWAMEAFAAFLGVAYLWELCDALGRDAWVRRVGDAATRRSSAFRCRRTTSHPRW
jgi:hypothetical protein